MIYKPYSSSLNGFAIALAWPGTYCKQAGAWYDSLMRLLGMNRNNYYKAGHAAIVLVDDISGKCHYFDFGRYHAPYQFGRVRGENTDPELTIHTKAIICKSVIINLDNILNELAERKACHGAGDLHASVCRINFNKAFSVATKLQKISPIKYGPFIWGGTNCSRFVRHVLRSGIPAFGIRIKLLLPLTITPSPLSNILALGKAQRIKAHFISSKPQYVNTDKVLPAPVRAADLPDTAQWLSGEGAGSWYYIECLTQKKFKVSRFDEEGLLEFADIYELADDSVFDEDKHFQISYPSHFQVITLLQNGVMKVFLRFNSIQHVEPKEINEKVLQFAD